MTTALKRNVLSVFGFWTDIVEDIYTCVLLDHEDQPLPLLYVERTCTIASILGTRPPSGRLTSYLTTPQNSARTRAAAFRGSLSPKPRAYRLNFLFTKGGFAWITGRLP